MIINDFSYVANAVSTAYDVGIDELIVEPGGLSGINDDRTVIMFQRGKLPFGSFGMKKLRSLSKKLDVIVSQGEYCIDMDVRKFKILDVNKNAMKLKKYNIIFDIKDYDNKSKARASLHSEVMILNERYLEKLCDSIKNLGKLDAKIIRLKKNLKLDELNLKHKIVSEGKLKNIPGRIRKSKIKIEECVSSCKVFNDELYTLEKDSELILKVKNDVYDLGDYSSHIKCVSKDSLMIINFYSLENMQVPCSLNDVQKIIINVDVKDILVLKKASKIEGNDFVEVLVKNQEVFLNAKSYADDGEDVSVKIGQSDNDIDVSFSYPIEVFVKFMGNGNSFTIGEKGIFHTVYKGYDFYLLPRERAS